MPGGIATRLWNHSPKVSKAQPTICLPHVESCRASMSDSGHPAADFGEATEAAGIASAVRRSLEGRVMVNLFDASKSQFPEA